MSSPEAQREETLRKFAGEAQDIADGLKRSADQFAKIRTAQQGSDSEVRDTTRDRLADLAAIVSGVITLLAEAAGEGGIQ